MIYVGLKREPSISGEEDSSYFMALSPSTSNGIELAGLSICRLKAKSLVEPGGGEVPVH